MTSSFLRRIVPPGSTLIGVALGVNGALTYLFLALAGAMLDPERFAVFSVGWASLFVLGPGLFQPVEQRVARTAPTTGGTDLFDTLGSVRGEVLGTIGVLGIGALLLWRVGLGDLFYGEAMVAALSFAALCSFALLQVARGALASAGRFDRMAAALVLTGMAKALGATALFLNEWNSVEALLAVLAISYSVGAVPALSRRHPLELAPASRPKADQWLLLGSLSEAILLHSGPLVVSRVPDTEPGRFLALVVVTRIPLFAFHAVKVAVIPHAAGLVHSGDTAGVRRLAKQVLSLAMVGGICTIVGSGLVGPWTVARLVGAEVSSVEAMILATSSALLVAGLLVTAVLVALRRDRAIALSFAGGAALFLALAAMSGRTFAAVGVGLILGSAAVLTGLLWSLWGATDAYPPSRRALIETGR